MPFLTITPHTEEPWIPEIEKDGRARQGEEAGDATDPRGSPFVQMTSKSVYSLRRHIKRAKCSEHSTSRPIAYDSSSVGWSIQVSIGWFLNKAEKMR